MFTYLRKSILLSAKSSKVDACFVYGKYSQKDASAYTLVLGSAHFFFNIDYQDFLNLHG